MTSGQLQGTVAVIGIYAVLIAFVLYRQMSAQPLRPRRLVLLPAVLGFFAVQQLGRQQIAVSLGTVMFLVLNLALGLAAGIWRGTTFRLWTEAGVVMTKGTVVTLLTWGVLIGIRLLFALAGHVASFPQGLMIGELLLALAVTFAAQNVVIWLRSSRMTVMGAAR